MGIAAQLIINGIIAGGIYALVALGYTMVYGILRFINFAHGEIYIFAGYFSLKDFRSPDTLSVNSNGALEEQIITENQELLENMELLQEMEALEQLVNLLDKQYPETSLLDSERDANNVSTHV